MPMNNQENVVKLPTHMSVGRDYRNQLIRYEYVLFADDETIVARDGGYPNSAKARRAGQHMAHDLLSIKA